MIKLPQSTYLRIVISPNFVKIDEEETKRGNKVGKPREKFVSTHKILTYLKKGKNKNGTH